MKIHEFNNEKGVYKFELNEIETEFHAHPAVEIIFSENGNIELETTTSKYINISFAVIEHNILHKIKSKKGNVLLLMMECNLSHFQKLLSNFDISLLDGIYVEANNTDRAEIIEEIAGTHNRSIIPITANKRIQKCLNYLNSTSAEYKVMLEVLRSETNLSESRLSHLFKKEMGISIKKYLVWSKLKRAFEGVLYKNMNMYEVSIESGFYDQAHLSKSFKQMLGISPSDVYNSRMLQV